MLTDLFLRTYRQGENILFYAIPGSGAAQPEMVKTIDRRTIC